MSDHDTPRPARKPRSPEREAAEGLKAKGKPGTPDMGGNAPSDFDYRRLVKYTMNNLHRISLYGDPKSRTRVEIIAEVFGLGATSADQFCKEFGFNPDEMVGGFEESEESPPDIRALAERIERALRHPNEGGPCDPQTMGDRNTIDAEADRRYHQQYASKSSAAREARVSWLCLVLRETLGGAGGDGEQEGEGKGTNP